MKTYMADSSLQKQWYVVDAEGKTLGRLASQVAAILIGKHKPESIRPMWIPAIM